jgi:hypothetical protein
VRIQSIPNLGRRFPLDFAKNPWNLRSRIREICIGQRRQGFFIMMTIYVGLMGMGAAAAFLDWSAQDRWTKGHNKPEE